METNNPFNSKPATLFFISGAILFTCSVLKLGESLFIPLGFAFFLSVILYPLCRILESRGVGRQLAVFAGLLLVMIFSGTLIFLFGIQLQKIAVEWPQIHARLTELLYQIRNWLSENFGVRNEELTQWLLNAINNSMGSSVNYLGSTIQSMLVNFALLALVPVYTYLLLIYRTRIVELIKLLFPVNERSKIMEVLRLAIDTYFKFVKGMIVVYASVGTLNSIGLWMMGIPNAFLFGYLTAVMTFIPYVGIIVASILPITYAWTTYGIIWYPLGVIALFAFVQYLEANIIFPWAVGKKLDLNTLATLIVIVIGGIIWGASGMILFVPFAAILKLVADRIPGWEPLSIVLGNEKLKSRTEPPKQN